MKVLLIQPSRSEHPNRQPPLGLASIGAILEQRGCVTKIIDCHAPYAHYSVKDILSIIYSFRPDIIGIHLMTYFVKQVYQLIKEIKNLKTPVIGGGPHATLRPEEVLSNLVDIVVRGEGEKTVSELIDFFRGEIKIEDILGISYKDKNFRIIHNKPRPFISNLDTLPFPTRHLFVKEDYIRNPREVDTFGNIIASRGCPGQCTYCSAKSVFGKKYRFRSAENVLKEIQFLHDNYGITHFDFMDDTLTGNKKFIQDFCDLVIEKVHYDIFWHAITRPDQVTKELLCKMREAGCVSVIYGIESGNDKTLKRIRKGFTVDRAKQTVIWTKEAGIRCEVNFMWGFPWEDEQEIENSLDLVKELIPLAGISPGGILVPFPGTQIYDEYKVRYRFEDWWLNETAFNSSFRKNNNIPFYQRYYFDDHGQLLGQKMSFFNYEPRIRGKLKCVADLIGSSRIRGLCRRNFPIPKAFLFCLEKILCLLAHLSIKLYRVNPKLEEAVFKIIFYKPLKIMSRGRFKA